MNTSFLSEKHKLILIYLQTQICNKIQIGGSLGLKIRELLPREVGDIDIFIPVSEFAKARKKIELMFGVTNKIEEEHYLDNDSNLKSIKNHCKFNIGEVDICLFSFEGKRASDELVLNYEENLITIKISDPSFAILAKKKYLNRLADKLRIGKSGMSQPQKVSFMKHWDDIRFLEDGIPFPKSTIDLSNIVDDLPY